MLSREREPLRTDGREVQRDVDRTRWSEAWRMEHLARGAVDLDHIAAQQPPELRHIRHERVPCHRLLAHRATCGEASPERGNEPSGRELLDRRDRRRRDHDMTQTRHRDTRTEADCGRALGDAWKRYPATAVERR